MIELLALVQSPHFALVAFLIFVALLATGVGLVSKRDDHEDARHYVPLASDEPGPVLEPELVDRIIREAHRAARIDHAHETRDRASTYPRHSRAAVLWTGAYLGLRAELEHASGDRLGQAAQRTDA